MACAKLIKLGASFSTGKISPTHNFRKGDIPNNVDRERIKDNIVLIDNLKGRTIEQYTNDEMQKHIDSYNKKQKQKCRRIKGTYSEWHMDNGRYTQNKKNREDVKLAYEAVICYGNNEDLWKEYFSPETSEDRKRELYDEAILYYKKAVAEFMKRYKHLEIIYAVIHADEPNGSIHCHLCFQPRAEYTRGLGVQVCISKALEQDGIEKVKERMDAKEEGYQLTRLYREFRHQVLNRQMKELGYEIKEEVHGLSHAPVYTFTEKMKEIDEREKKVKKAELFVEQSLDIEAEERKLIKSDGQYLTFIPEKKNMFGKVIEEEKVMMPRSVYESKMVPINIQNERYIIERTVERQNKIFKQAVESNLTNEDIKTRNDYEKLKGIAQKQYKEINRLQGDLDKAYTKIDNLRYTIQKIKDFARENFITQKLSRFLKPFLNPEMEMEWERQ